MSWGRPDGPSPGGAGEMSMNQSTQRRANPNGFDRSNECRYSGLKAHMDALNVVGNNVANVNTQGYKPGRVTFMESIYSTQSAGSAGTATVGGTNPRQTGYGVGIGTIDLDMSSQSLDSTGRGMDCAIQGDGFFLVGDKTHDIDSMDALKGLTLTRVGNFEFRDGYLTDGQGNVVYGFITRSNGDDPGTTPGDKPSTDLVPIRLPMKSTDPNSKGDAVYVGVDNQTGANVYPDNDPAATVDGFVDLENISIDKNGKITGTNKDTGDPVVVGYIALGSVENLNGVLHTEGPYYTAGDAAGDIRVGTPGNSVTGNLRNDKITDGNNVVDPDSALAEGSGATLMTGFLEASGTDLATEFANMIIYQRGYQANTRIVTVTDTMLEELVNMKR